MKQNKTATVKAGDYIRTAFGDHAIVTDVRKDRPMIGGVSFMRLPDSAAYKLSVRGSCSHRDITEIK